MRSGTIQVFLAVLLSGTAFSVRAQAPAPSQPAKRPAKVGKMRKAPAHKRLDLNTASKAQLAKLPGLNEAYAEQIIAHRPYLTKEHLVLNKVLPQPLFLSIREYVTAIPPGARKAPVRAKGQGK